MRERLRTALAAPRLPYVIAGLAFLLGAPSLGLGLQTDDYVLKMALSDPPLVPEWSRSPALLFAFIGGEAAVASARDAGAVPWWTSPGLRLAFFRPIAGITHWLDFQLWPQAPWLMHVQSLLWFAAMVAAAAVAYRRLLGAGAIAGLAALAFTLDDAHASPAVWLANRNALLGTLFGLLALIAHDRWRREGWTPGAVLAPLAAALGLLSGEIALAAFAYLLAYALFLDRAPGLTRLASLVPAGLVGAAWALAYRAFGFGASGSSMYLDPGGDPVVFAKALLDRGPLLLMGQWALPSHLVLILSESAARVFWLSACVLALVLVGLLWPLVRRDSRARFFALGMLLSLVPAAATMPHDRLLVFAGFGGAGLLAQLLVGLVEGAAWRPDSAAWRTPARVLGVILAIFHFVLAPLVLLRGAADMKVFGDVLERTAATMPDDAAITGQDAVVVQTPAAFVSIQAVPIRVVAGQPLPKRLLVLGSGRGGTTVERTASDVLVVRPEGGFLLPRGRALPSEEGRAAPVDTRYLLSIFDGLYRDDPALPLGTRIALRGVTVEITALTPDQRPAEVRFIFDRSLDDPSLRWLAWENGGYVPFTVPAVGARTQLPPVGNPFS